jgi:hypothetical protein
MIIACARGHLEVAELLLARSDIAVYWVDEVRVDRGREGGGVGGCSWVGRQGVGGDGC